MADPKQQRLLMMAHLGLAKSELTGEQFAKVEPEKIQRYIRLVLEVVPAESLVDKTLIRHALHGFVEEQSVEEVVLHVFMLYIYKLCKQGSGHPLEKGIIRQKIMSLVPIFENAYEKQLIREVYFVPKIEALISIAESEANKDQVIQLLESEYHRLADPR